MAANPRRGEIAFTIAGESFVAVATLERVAAMEAALGITGLHELQDRMGRASTKDTLAMAAALTGSDTLGAVALLVDLPAIRDACISALTFGSAPGNAEAAPVKA